MSRRSTGPVGAWAEVQRQRQRQAEAAERQRREQVRQAAAHQRRLMQSHREYRQAEAARRTRELDAQVAALQGLLTAGCGAPAFSADRLRRAEETEPFAPGPLAYPLPMPDPRQYETNAGWTANRRAQAQAEARARFERDWHAAQAAEAQRQQQFAAYRQAYEQGVAAHRAEVRQHNAGVQEVVDGVRRGDPESVVEFFSAALYASAAWPEGFPRQVSAAYDAVERQLVVDWELPRYDVVPEARSVRYVASTDQDKETARPATQRRALYREVVAECLLLVLHQLFSADAAGALGSVALNGFVDDHDPATGRRGSIYLATALAPREVFTGLHLAQVDSVSCLTDALRGQLTSRPDQLAAVRPARRPEDVRNRVVSYGGDGEDPGEEPDLYTMDPVEFENLVGDLFRAMGMQVSPTPRSNDGGVDLDVLDPRPIQGGKIVVQVKRYRSTVEPAVVRDLFGTVQARGANKGILVTTSGFGPQTHAFVEGKPLELMAGVDLVELLHQHGLRGRLGEGRARRGRSGGGARAGRAATAGAAAAGAPAARTPAARVPASGAATAGAPAARTPASGATAAGTSAARRAVAGAATARTGTVRRTRSAGATGPTGHSVLSLTWTGATPVDVCALVCRGERALSDEHFVFFNNAGTPDGAVRVAPAVAPDRAALQVAFDALPAEADRLLLAAAVDPQAAPDADLAGFAEARLRLLDHAGAEVDRLDVSDGRPHETALVLGSFRRRPNGDWAFVLGGKGYPGGLPALLRDHGIIAT